MSPEVIAGIAVGAMVLIVAFFFIVFSCGVLVAGMSTCSLEVCGYGIITFKQFSGQLQKCESPPIPFHATNPWCESPVLPFKATEPSPLQRESPTVPSSSTEPGLLRRESPSSSTEPGLLQRESPTAPSSPTEPGLLQRESPSSATEPGLLQCESPSSATEPSPLQCQSPAVPSSATEIGQSGNIDEGYGHDERASEDHQSEKQDESNA